MPLLVEFFFETGNDDIDAPYSVFATIQL